MNFMQPFISSRAYSCTSSSVYLSGMLRQYEGSLKRLSWKDVVIMLPSQGILQVMKHLPNFGKSSHIATPASPDGSGQTSAGTP